FPRVQIHSYSMARQVTLTRVDHAGQMLGIPSRDQRERSACFIIEVAVTTRREFLLATTVAAAAQAPRTPVIDCHTHAGTADTLTAPWTTIADPQEILRRNHEAGIQQACIFPISHDTFEEANREIASIVRKYHGRFIGFAKHDPVNEKGRIRDLLPHECRELGLRGLKLHVEPTAEVLDTVAALGIPILWHPRRVAMFDDVAKSYPMIDVILAHLGSDLSADWREHLAAIDMARRHPN